MGLLLGIVTRRNARQELFIFRTEKNVMQSACQRPPTGCCDRGWRAEIPVGKGFAARREIQSIVPGSCKSAPARGFRRDKRRNLIQPGLRPYNRLRKTADFARWKANSPRRRISALSENRCFSDGRDCALELPGRRAGSRAVRQIPNRWNVQSRASRKTGPTCGRCGGGAC
jgi:hypothetical protein